MPAPLPEDDLELTVLWELVSAWRALIDRRYPPKPETDPRPNPWELLSGVPPTVAPIGATEETHPAERRMIKPITHGSNYGISAYGVARKLNCSLTTARRLLHAYDLEHWRFRQWQCTEPALKLGPVCRCATVQAHVECGAQLRGWTGQDLDHLNVGALQDVDLFIQRAAGRPP